MNEFNKGIKTFDLIIVFTKCGAKSAKANSYHGKTPFFGKYKIFNDSYNYFLSKCKDIGIKAAFTTSRDIIGPGLFQSFWTYDKKWIRNKNKIYSKIIFDRFGRINSEQKNKLKLLTFSKSINVFNLKTIDVLGDKLTTYKNFKEFVIPSVEIKNHSKKDIYLAKTKLDRLLKKHKNKGDFNNSYVTKSRRGYSGIGIFKINFDNDFDNIYKKIKKYLKLTKDERLTSYLLQPFIKYDKSLIFGKHKRFTDLRIILINHKIVQAYIRIAKKGDFRCNEHQGGNLIYISKKKIPQDILTMSSKIIKKLKLNPKLKHSLYTLDFIKSNNRNLYFVEGNSKPGLDWNHKKKTNEIKSKELINLIVNELKSFIKENETRIPKRV